VGWCLATQYRDDTKKPWPELHQAAFRSDETWLLSSLDRAVSKTGPGDKAEWLLHGSEFKKTAKDEALFWL